MADFIIKVEDTAGNVVDQVTVSVSDGESVSRTVTIDNPAVQVDIGSGN